MITLYFRLAFALHGLLQRHAPTNSLVRAARGRTGSTWLPVATLLAGFGYLYAASTCANIVEHGGTGWVDLVVLVFSWNSIKLGAAGMIGVANQTVTWFLPSHSTHGAAA